MEDELKPTLRGKLHFYAFFVAVVAGVVLEVLAPTERKHVAVAIYAVALAGVFGASALYHARAWSLHVARRLRKLDHSMIFVMIAGTYTPFALVVFTHTLATVVLAVAWGGAVLGFVFNLVWIDAPRWLVAALYIAMGWIGVLGLPQLIHRGGLAATILVALGGLIYTAGAVTYALKRPNPFPRVFGFHEVFHTAVIAAAGAHYAAIATVVLPHGQ